MNGAAAAPYPARKIFVLSSLALFAAGLSFSLRAGIIGDIEREILVGIDSARVGELSGGLLGTAFGGFAFTLLFGSILLDRIGMGRMLVVCGLCFASGTALAIAAPELASGDAVYTLLRAGFLLSGLGWGFMEASVNPLTTALYPDDKTHRLNILHAWWPAGLMVGGTSVLVLEAAGVGWQGQFAIVIVPVEESVESDDPLPCVPACLRLPHARPERLSLRPIGEFPCFQVHLDCL